MILLKFEFDPVVLGRIFLNLVNFSSLLSPLKKHLYKLEFPSPNDALCHLWFKFSHTWSGVDENVKILQTYGQMVDAQQVIRRPHLTIQLR